MTKQNKNRRGQTTMDEMVKSGSQLIMMHDDGTEQPIEEIAKQSGTLKIGTTMKVIDMDKSGFDNESSEPDPYAGEYHYKSWWNQFRGPWLKSETMTEEQIKIKADDAWECGDYKEMINLMAELICRLQQK
ncbi:MAG: hypothetical protein PHQ41_07715 [Candidatus Cloacimonetes bacterium]|nr:hypothetical protein [Candidatus Cloacimonadota bacterium]